MMVRLVASHKIETGLFIFILALFCMRGGGRTYAAETELPCAEEISKYCKEVKPGGGRILDCLNEHQQDLSASCKNKLEEAKKRLMEAQKACTGDMEKFCKDVQPGGGRILKCLREHTEELSPACREVIEKTKGKVQEKPQSGQ